MMNNAKLIVKEIISFIENSSSWGFGQQATIAKLCAHSGRLSRFLAGLDMDITPVNLEVWPSLTCNARCALCPYVRNSARQIADCSTVKFQMHLSLFEKIAYEFKQAGGLSINLTGGGEPTMHPQLTDFGRLSSKYGLDWGLFTNGYNLRPNIIDALLENSPAYVRVSVNSWSADSHNDTYHLGLNAYDTVRENFIYLAQQAPRSTAIGIGYIMNHITPKDLYGIKTFIEKVHDASSRLDYVAIRPSVLYYKAGEPLRYQPHAERFLSIPDKCREVLSSICEARDVVLHVNANGFEAIAKKRPPTNCIAIPWATSTTENGRLYLLSEANGSPESGLEELAYGQVTDRMTFIDAWNSSYRKELTRKFAQGEKLTPVIHKLSGLDEALKTLRAKFGIIEWKVAEQVGLELAQRSKLKHWMFI